MSWRGLTWRAPAGTTTTGTIYYLQVRYWGMYGSGLQVSHVPPADMHKPAVAFERRLDGDCHVTLLAGICNYIT